MRTRIISICLSITAKHQVYTWRKFRCFNRTKLHNKVSTIIVSMWIPPVSISSNISIFIVSRTVFKICKSTITIIICPWSVLSFSTNPSSVMNHDGLNKILFFHIIDYKHLSSKFQCIFICICPRSTKSWEVIFVSFVLANKIVIVLSIVRKVTIFPSTCWSTCINKGYVNLNCSFIFF